MGEPGLVGEGVPASRQSLPLVRTKLSPPLLRADLVPRPRLLERLSRASSVPLTLICAPAGYGKTTLVQEWLRSPAGSAHPLAWLSLDEDDNDPSRFLAYLATALEPIVPVAAAEALALLAPHHPASARAVLTPLINAVGALSAEPVLVLDDYHLIDAPGVHQALAYLLEHMPRQLHLVLATRSDPALPLPRLRARHLLVELRSGDLRFTPEEATSFLNASMGLELSSDDIAALEARTEGWIAGLQLAALSLQGRRDVAAVLATLSGAHPSIFDYLAEEIFQRQPSHIQEFLLDTCILERLNAPLCDTLIGAAATDEPTLGRVPAQETMAQLEQRNLFLVSLDGSRQWYRYHQLFQDFLRARLARVAPERQRRLHRQATQWHERNGMGSEAVTHALASQDWPYAAQIVEQAGALALQRGETTTLQHWLQALPDELLLSQPRLALLQAWLSLLNLQLGATDGMLDAAERGLREAEPGEEDPAIEGELVALRAMSAVFRGDVRTGAALARERLERLAGDNLFLRSVAAFDDGVAAVVDGDTRAATAAFAQAVRYSEQAGNPLLIAMARWQSADQLVVQGQLQQAARAYGEIIQLMTGYSGEELPLAGMAYSGLGEILLEWDRLDEAGRYLEQGIALSLLWSPITAMDGYRNLARLRQIQGRRTEVYEALLRAIEIARQSEFITLDEVGTMIPSLRLWIEEGEHDELARWVAASVALLEGERGADDELPYLAREATSIALARVLLAQGSPEQALRWLATTLPEARRRGRLGVAIEAGVLRVVALVALDRRAEALEALEALLLDAEPGGYIQPFVEHRATLASLLRELRPVNPSVAAYLRRLTKACEHRRIYQGDATPGAPSPAGDARSWEHGSHEQPLAEPLSARERAVLQLIAAGLSNEAIASRLVVTRATVKTHINNLYGKLGVSSRTQALARARALGLLNQ